MKKHSYKHLGLLAGLVSAFFAIDNLQAEPFTPTIAVTTDVVSNYVFRGADVLQNRFIQDGKSYGSMNIAPAFQPNLAFNFAEGWSLNVWGSFALMGRGDKDIDGFFQGAPGDTMSFVPDATATNYVSAISNGSLSSSTFQNAYPGSYIFSNDVLGRKFGTNAPGGYYKEAVGLKRNDEIDLTLGYSMSTKLGTMTGGVISYNYPNTAQYLATNLELYGGFSPAKLPEVSLTLYVEGASASPGAGSTYEYLAYTKAFELSKDSNITIAPGIGYATSTTLHIQGIKNVNLPITYNMGGFHVGVTGVYRPNLAFFDNSQNTSGDTAMGNGINIVGGSTIYDGLVPDPARNAGVANAYINAEISNKVNTGLQSAGLPYDPAGSNGYKYSYIPRQTLPKTLIYYTIGYTATF